VTHAGKLYNLAASRIAASIVAELPETAAATCTLVSTIGAPIREPAMVDITIAATVSDRTRTRIDDIVRGELAHLDRLRDELVASHLTIS